MTKLLTDEPRKGQAKPLTRNQRCQRYLDQTGRPELTPRQQRRVIKKSRRNSAEGRKRRARRR